MKKKKKIGNRKTNLPENATSMQNFDLILKTKMYFFQGLVLIFHFVLLLLLYNWTNKS